MQKIKLKGTKTIYNSKQEAMTALSGQNLEEREIAFFRYIQNGNEYGMLAVGTGAGKYSFIGNTADWLMQSTKPTIAFSEITNKPTTLAGYGITDAPTKTGAGASGTWGINISGTAANAAMSVKATQSKHIETISIEGFIGKKVSEAKTKLKEVINQNANKGAFLINLNSFGESLINNWSNDNFVLTAGNTMCNVFVTNAINNYAFLQITTYGSKKHWEVALVNGSWGSMLQNMYVGDTASAANSVPWSGVTGKPTTLAGYGITDAPTKTGGGASGLWQINITGAAANATQLGGIVAANYWHTGNSNSRNVNWNANALSANTGLFSSATATPLTVHRTDTDGNIVIVLKGKTITKHLGIANGELRFGDSADVVSTGKTVWHSGNFNPSSKPNNDGAGASGTWRINITGNAATSTTASTANSVAWGNISGKPSTFAPAPHTHSELNGSNYIGGGNEKPSYFGAGKLRYQMLSGSNLGNGTSSWYDCLWISSYTGGDVKPSTLISISKGDPAYMFVSTQNYDSTSWGTQYRIWNSKNFDPNSKPNRDGTGATGLWQISITGLAANASQLGGIVAANFYHTGNLNNGSTPFRCSTLTADSQINSRGLRIDGSGYIGGILEVTDKVKTNTIEAFSGGVINLRSTIDAWFSASFYSGMSVEGGMDVTDGIVTDSISIRGRDNNYVLLAGGEVKPLSEFGGGGGLAGRVSIVDNRANSWNPAQYPDRTVFFEFTNKLQGTPYGGNWTSVMTVKGWEQGYKSWQLMAYSSTNSGEADRLYFRGGINTSWGSFKEILHTGNSVRTVGAAYVDLTQTRQSDSVVTMGCINSNINTRTAGTYVFTHNLMDNRYIPVVTILNNKGYNVRIDEKTPEYLKISVVNNSGEIINDRNLKIQVIMYYQ